MFSLLERETQGQLSNAGNGHVGCGEAAKVEHTMVDRQLL